METEPSRPFLRVTLVVALFKTAAIGSEGLPACAIRSRTGSSWGVSTRALFDLDAENGRPDNPPYRGLHFLGADHRANHRPSILSGGRPGRHRRNRRRPQRRLTMGGS